MVESATFGIEAMSLRSDLIHRKRSPFPQPGKATATLHVVYLCLSRVRRCSVCAKHNIIYGNAVTSLDAVHIICPQDNFICAKHNPFPHRGRLWCALASFIINPIFAKSENLPLLLPKAKTSLVLCTNFTVRTDNFTFAEWQKLHLSSLSRGRQPLRSCSVVSATTLPVILERSEGSEAEMKETLQFLPAQILRRLKPPQE